MTSYSIRTASRLFFMATGIITLLTVWPAQAESVDDGLDLVADCMSYQAAHRNGAMLIDEVTAMEACAGEMQRYNEMLQRSGLTPAAAAAQAEAIARKTFVDIESNLPPCKPSDRQPIT